jgi:hypothetical protein
MKTCDKCGKALSEPEGFNFGMLKKEEFELCKICQKKFELHKLEFFDK